MSLAPFTAALDRVQPDAAVVIGAGCGPSTALMTSLTERAERFARGRLWSGLLVGDYPFMREDNTPAMPYGTWHVMPPIVQAVAEGNIDYYAIRASAVAGFVRGQAPAPTVLVQVSPPDRDGYSSLGVSAGYLHAVLSHAGTVIAHVNPEMPATPGPARIKLSDATHVVTHAEPLREYRTVAIDDTSRQIAGWVEPLIPDGATLQVGIGSIPEAVMEILKDAHRTKLAIWGLGTDGVVTFAENGLLRPGVSVCVVELMGSRRVFDWADRNDACRLVGFDLGASAVQISAIPNFVSINSALQVDLHGNLNAEVVKGRQISGVGGSLDYTDGARAAPGGRCIIALPATARGGSLSRIVVDLEASASMTRTSTQFVATEYGCVDLSVLSLDARAEAMCGIAAPQFRDGLWNSYAKKRHRGSI